MITRDPCACCGGPLQLDQPFCDNCGLAQRAVSPPPFTVAAAAPSSDFPTQVLPARHQPDYRGGAGHSVMPLRAKLVLALCVGLALVLIGSALLPKPPIEERGFESHFPPTSSVPTVGLGLAHGIPTAPRQQISGPASNGGTAYIYRDLQVLDAQMRPPGAGFAPRWALSGQVRNTGTLLTQLVQVRARLYTTDSTILDDAQTYAAGNVLAPGGTVPFAMEFAHVGTQIPDLTHYDLWVDGQVNKP